MTPDRLRRVASVLELVLELDDESRAAYLETYSVQDPELVADLRRHLIGES